MTKDNMVGWHHQLNRHEFEKAPGNAGKDRRREEKGMTEDEMVGWHHQLNRHELE